MDLSKYDFLLPDNQIARFPAEPRDESRLLVTSRSAHTISHQRFWGILEFLEEGDVLVLNNTRVIPARLFAQLGTSEIELLLLESLDDGLWTCLVKPGKKVKTSRSITFKDGTQGTVTRLPGDQFQVQIQLPKGVSDLDWLKQNGVPPLPPYLKREANEKDVSSYQTVFAKVPGSVAAPTAGLHFTQELLKQARQKGVQVCEITLHVGYGTFAPLQEACWESSTLHSEFYSIDPQIIEKIITARANKKSVIAVGSTSLRALESVPFYGLSGKTNIFIKPGFDFKYVDALVTNFHLPKSSLFILVSSFLGEARAKTCYEEAIRQGYRFYSYGDAMLIAP